MPKVNLGFSVSSVTQKHHISPAAKGRSVWASARSAPPPPPSLPRPPRPSGRPRPVRPPRPAPPGPALPVLPGSGESRGPVDVLPRVHPCATPASETGGEGLGSGGAAGPWAEGRAAALGRPEGWGGSVPRGRGLGWGLGAGGAPEVAAAGRGSWGQGGRPRWLRAGAPGERALGEQGRGPRRLRSCLCGHLRDGRRHWTYAAHRSVHGTAGCSAAPSAHGPSSRAVVILLHTRGD